jgi:hypothetical protein
MTGLLLCLISIWLVAVISIAWTSRRELRQIGREPVFRAPVLVLDSDDWGAGPLSQAAALCALADVLAAHRDVAGRAPVMNLALVLAVPDGPSIRAGGVYRRVGLDDPRFAPVLEALSDGRTRGVFALQLHGLEHCGPPALMAARDEPARQWLMQEVPAATEQLPAHLQTRWVDASTLPSTPLPAGEMEAAVAEEVREYTRIVGQAPEIVVPPTFVWTRAVEAAWAAQGLRCVVTPGWRYLRRNAEGLPDGDEGPIVNGDRAGGIVYLARTDYFEPVRGRGAVHALQVLASAVAEGRVCVLENHRDNFIGAADTCRRSLAELDELCREALRHHPDLCFVSAHELCRIVSERDKRWLVSAWRGRLPYRWARLRHSGRLWKLMVVLGVAAIGALVVRLLGAPAAAAQRRHLA